MKNKLDVLGIIASTKKDASYEVYKTYKEEEKRPYITYTNKATNKQKAVWEVVKRKTKHLNKKPYNNHGLTPNEPVQNFLHNL